MPAHPSRTIGNSPFRVFPIGLGCASLSGSYGPAEEAMSIRVLHAAFEQGVTMLDTSDKYGAGHNEELIARAIRGRGEAIRIASKFGNLAGRDGKFADGRPETVFASCEASLKRLKIETIHLYYQHRIDPEVPVEETVGAMSQLVEQGKVVALGLCEANPCTLRRAHAIHPISAIQSEYSILYRAEAEEVRRTSKALGISFVAYAPLGRGLLTGAVAPDTLGEHDERLRHPRFSAENLPHNLELVHSVEHVAAQKGCTAGQVALAWLLAQGGDVIPIPGTKSLHRLAENIGAANIVLNQQEIDFLAAAIPPDAVAGSRYRAEHMKNMYL
ncbi:MAG TPA: aldo/keto reductase [Stellaceae bacterium]|nr:aldo/keto reductase [Stellaceae bacterium]